ncbi:MAG: hypothetical protein IH795_09655 [Bacteroidetes bacterium]|nr:hypothetical protein [Bacteroidota bacterium]
MTEKKFIQWTGDNLKEINAFCGGGADIRFSGRIFFSHKSGLGNLALSLNEYLIQSTTGGFYVSRTSPEDYDKR